MNLEKLETMVGEEVGLSDWIELDQSRIGVFADCTEDRQWIHIDAERARAESPFGAPVAHGYLTLSLLTRMQETSGALPSDATSIVNYGLDSARFITPVLSGSRIRNRVSLASFERKKGNAWRATYRNIVEIEGEEKPALIAENILLYFSE